MPEDFQKWVRRTKAMRQGLHHERYRSHYEAPAFTGTVTSDDEHRWVMTETMSEFVDRSCEGGVHLVYVPDRDTFLYAFQSPEDEAMFRVRFTN